MLYVFVPLVCFVYWDKIKSKKYHSVGTFPKCYKKIAERRNVDTLGTCTSIKTGGVSFVLYTHDSLLMFSNVLVHFLVLFVMRIFYINFADTTNS